MNDMMKRISLFLVLFVGGVLLMGADGCSSDPNVEGAKLDLRNKDYDRALENVNKALEANPQNAEALKLKGDIFMAQAFEPGVSMEEHSQLLEQMTEAYSAAVEANPEMEGDISQARRAAYIKESQEGAEDLEAGQQDASRYAMAAAHFANTAMIEPDSVNAYMRQANALLRTEDQVAAIQPFEMVVEKSDPAPMEVYLYLSDLYRMDERPDAALTLLEDATEVYPENDELMAALLNAYIATGQTEEALTRFEAAIAENPDNAVYRYTYGSLLLEAGRPNEAAEQLEMAAELEPDNAVTQYNLGAAYVNQAVEINDRMIELDDQARSGDVTREERNELEDQIVELRDQRTEFFENAIPPLERARDLAQGGSGEANLQGICGALYQAYANTGQEEKAEEVSECAGFGS